MKTNTNTNTNTNATPSTAPHDLAASIAAIAPNDTRRSLEAFAQVALCGLEELHEMRGGLGLGVETAYDYLGFLEVEDVERRLEERATQAMGDYLDLVWQAKPFTDLLGPLFNRGLGRGQVGGDGMCGVGTRLLAGAQEAHARGMAKNHAVAGNDVDPLCAALAAVQLFASQVLHAAVLGEVRVFCEPAPLDSDALPVFCTWPVAAVGANDDGNQGDDHE